MKDDKPSQPAFVGRDVEVAAIAEMLAEASRGRGGTAILLGEPGIGKSAVASEAVQRARAMGFTVVQGSAAHESLRPYLAISAAISALTGEPLFRFEEQACFSALLMLDASDGRLLAKAFPPGGENLDAEALADLVNAVQRFVGDSFAGASGALERIVQGDRTIIAKRAGRIALVALVEGQECAEMRFAVDSAVASFESWPADTQATLDELAGRRFTVRRSFDGGKIENERIRVANRALEAVQASAATAPLLMVLEDLHWADEGTLSVLRYLARNIAGSRVVLLATARPTEGAAQASIKAILEENIAAAFALGGLDVAGVIKMIDATLCPNDLPTSFAGRLHRDCAGNPLFIRELLRQMVEDGSISESGGSFYLEREDYAMPSSVGEIVSRRLASLDPDAMAMAEYASCAGRAFPAGAALSASSLSDPGVSLDKLVAAGIVVKAGEACEFVHALFQAAAYDGLSARWRTAHHKSLGEHYEAAFSGAPGDAVYEMARHFHLGGVPAKALEYCQRAGEAAVASFAADAAIGYYRDALDAASRLPRTPVLATARSDILERMGDIHQFAGNYPAAIASFREAAESGTVGESLARLLRKTALAHSSRSDRKSAEEALSEGYAIARASPSSELGRLLVTEATVRMAVGEYDRGSELCDEALDAFETTTHEERDVAQAYRVAGAISYRRGLFDKSLEQYRESLAHLGPADEDETAHVTLNMGIAHTDKGEYAKALDCLARSQTIFERRRDKKSLGTVQNSMGIVNWLMGNLEKARMHYTASLDCMRRIGNLTGEATILNNLGAVCFSAGDPSSAKDYYARSLAARRRLGDRSGVAQTLGNLGALLIDVGDLDDALERLNECIAISGDIGDNGMLATGLLNKVELLNFKGQTEGVGEILDRCMALFNDSGDLSTVVDAHASRSLHLIVSGDVGRSVESAKNALECALSLEVEAKGQVALARLALGRALHAVGDADGARRELEQVVALSNETGEKGMKAKALLELGLMMAESGDLDAREYLSDALQHFEAMGMRLWASRCKTALDALADSQRIG